MNGEGRDKLERKYTGILQNVMEASSNKLELKFTFLSGLE